MGTDPPPEADDNVGGMDGNDENIGVHHGMGTDPPPQAEDNIGGMDMNNISDAVGSGMGTDPPSRAVSVENKRRSTMSRKQVRPIIFHFSLPHFHFLIILIMLFLAPVIHSK